MSIGESEGRREGADLVSIVVATYKSAYLIDTLASLMKQTHRQIEILVLDDADDDACASAVAGLDDNRVRYIGNDRALGPALNHAKGIQLARGDFIALVNHDDVLAPDALQRFVDALRADPSAVAAFSRPRVIDADGIEQPERTAQAWKIWDLEGIPEGRIPNWYAIGRRVGFPLNPTALFRADALKSVPLPAEVGGSYDFWLSYRVARLGAVLHSPDAVGYWREHPANLTIVRSAARTYERVYLNRQIVLDSRLPATVRLKAVPRYLRAVAAWLRDRMSSARREGQVVQR